MKISRSIIDKIIQHAKRQAPVEACGYLARQGEIINKHYELSNIDHSSEHFSFDPKEQFEVIRNARAKGFEICAVYHSHPTTAARPSAEDIKLAFDPNLSYVIVSLCDCASQVKSFKIKAREAEQEVLEVIDDWL